MRDESLKAVRTHQKEGNMKAAIYGAITGTVLSIILMSFLNNANAQNMYNGWNQQPMDLSAAYQFADSLNQGPRQVPMHEPQRCWLEQRCQFGQCRKIQVCE